MVSSHWLMVNLDSSLIPAGQQSCFTAARHAHYTVNSAATGVTATHHVSRTDPLTAGRRLVLALMHATLHIRTINRQSVLSCWYLDHGIMEAAETTGPDSRTGQLAGRPADW